MEIALSPKHWYQYATRHGFYISCFKAVSQRSRRIASSETAPYKKTSTSQLSSVIFLPDYGSNDIFHVITKGFNKPGQFIYKYKKYQIDPDERFVKQSETTFFFGIGR
jgi:hypothetical protein